jgi:hypothetical protein
MEVSRGTDILVGPALDLGPPVKLVSKWSLELVFTSKVDDPSGGTAGFGMLTNGGQRIAMGESGKVAAPTHTASSLMQWLPLIEAARMIGWIIVEVRQLSE